MSDYTFGFVLEQTLGHITHSSNLSANIAKDESVEAVMAPIAFDVTGFGSKVPLYKSNWTVRAGLRARHAVSQMQQQHKVDALFVHTQVPAVLMTNWVKRIPTIVSLDATPRQYDQLGEHYAHAAGHPWVERLKWRANRDCFAQAKRLVTWSDWAKQGLIDEYQVSSDKIEVIPPGVNLDQWPEREESPSDKEGIKILFVGGDLQRKGGLDLLDAFRLLRSTADSQTGTPAIELHLVTRTPVAEEPGLTVYNEMEPNSTELKELFRQSHLFCLPTYGDCLPMVLSEAGAVGLPLISTDVAAISEILQDGKNGLLVRPGDVKGLAKALRTLIDDSALRNRMGKEAATLVRRKYDGAQNARRLLDLMREISDVTF